MLGYPNAANKIRAASGAPTTAAAVAPAAKTAETKINNSNFDDDDTSNSSKNKETKLRRRSRSHSGSKIRSHDPLPDEAGSRTQMSSAKSKSGFCYIGEDRGFRSCIKVSEGETCMSGDIFPTEAVCINPSLRP
jgi:hypothetical protein